MHPGEELALTFDELEPFYAEDGVTIYCCDSMELVHDIARSDALVYADPPYGVAERTARKSAGRGNLAECNDFEPVIGDDKPFDPTPWLACSRLVLWGANHYASRLPDSPTWLTWDKREGMSSNDNADCELAWTNLGGPARLFHHAWNGMIKASEKTERRSHPTQKPEQLASWVFGKYCGKEDLVIDPFMGSGSAIVAAKGRGLRAIGIDLDRRYCAAAVSRIKRATHLFGPRFPASKLCAGCERRLRVVVGVTFTEKRASKDGLQPYCRECDLDYKRFRRNGYVNFRRALREKGKGEECLWTEQTYNALMGVFRCFHCGNDVTEWSAGYWVDRLSSGRGYEPSNCVPCCKPCNFEKSNKNPEAFNHYIADILKRYPKGSVPWDEIGGSKFVHTSHAVPNLSEFVIPSEQTELFAARGRRTA